MKATGIVRRVDDLGRVVLPKELRNILHIAEQTPLEIYVDGEYVVLRKYEPFCLFCGGAEELEEYKGKNICHICMEELKG